MYFFWIIPFIHYITFRPSHLIISAPKKSESPHGHPDDEAIKIYKKYVDEINIHHLGKNRECIIVDIYEDGDLDIIVDKELVEHYGFTKEGDSGKYLGASVGAITSRMDRKPMGRYEVV